jgi:hypothetical protein
MKYAVEMGSVPMIGMPNFIKMGSGIQHGDCISRHKLESDVE